MRRNGLKPSAAVAWLYHEFGLDDPATARLEEAALVFEMMARPNFAHSAEI
jgi:hypothetical protein